ncbi:hypothetical protein, partial [Enterobacter mori]
FWCENLKETTCWVERTIQMVNYRLISLALTDDVFPGGACVYARGGANPTVDGWPKHLWCCRHDPEANGQALMGFLRRWLKSQAQFFFWTYIPIILTFIFGYVLDVYFPEVSQGFILLFYLVTLGLAYWIWH